MFFNKSFPDIDGIVLVGEFLAFLCRHLNLLVPLADVDCDRNNAIVIVPLFQERDTDGGVKPSGICK